MGTVYAQRFLLVLYEVIDHLFVRCLQKRRRSDINLCICFSCTSTNLHFISFFIFICIVVSLNAEGMNEDGSFIGQYGRHRKQEPNSQAFATLV